MIRNGNKTTPSINIIELCLPFWTIITEKDGPIPAWSEGTRSKSCPRVGPALASGKLELRILCAIDQVDIGAFCLPIVTEQVEISYSHGTPFWFTPNCRTL